MTEFSLAWATFKHEVFKALRMKPIVEWMNNKINPKAPPHTHNFQNGKVVMRGGDAFKDTAFTICQCECGQQAVWQYGSDKPHEWVLID